MSKPEDKDKLEKGILSMKLTAPKLSASARPKGSTPPPKPTLSTAVKTPKAARPPDAFGKPSLMIKNEDSVSSKHPSVRKLKDFLDNKRKKR